MRGISSRKEVQRAKEHKAENKRQETGKGMSNSDWVFTNILWLADHLVRIIEGTANKRTGPKDKGYIRR